MCDEDLSEDENQRAEQVSTGRGCSSDLGPQEAEQSISSTPSIKVEMEPEEAEE